MTDQAAAMRACGPRRERALRGPAPVDPRRLSRQERIVRYMGCATREQEALHLFLDWKAGQRR